MVEQKRKNHSLASNQNNAPQESLLQENSQKQHTEQHMDMSSSLENPFSNPFINDQETHNEQEVKQPQNQEQMKGEKHTRRQQEGESEPAESPHFLSEHVDVSKVKPYNEPYQQDGKEHGNDKGGFFFPVEAKDVKESSRKHYNEPSGQENEKVAESSQQAYQTQGELKEKSESPRAKRIVFVTPPPFSTAPSLFSPPPAPAPPPPPSSLSSSSSLPTKATTKELSTRTSRQADTENRASVPDRFYYVESNQKVDHIGKGEDEKAAVSPVEEKGKEIKIGDRRFVPAQSKEDQTPSSTSNEPSLLSSLPDELANIAETVEEKILEVSSEVKETTKDSVEYAAHKIQKDTEEAKEVAKNIFHRWVDRIKYYWDSLKDGFWGASL